MQIKWSSRIFGLLIGIIIFNLVGWPFLIRFTYEPLNYWVSLLLCSAIPLAILNYGRNFKKRSERALLIIISSIVAVPCVFLSIIIFVEACDVQALGKDPSHELLKEVSSGYFAYRLYRTDCGATCAFGLELRSELDTPIGIKFVRSDWSRYREENADLILIPNSEVKILRSGIPIGSIKL